MKDYKENLKRLIEVSKIGCCPGCGLTLEGLEQIISERDGLWELALTHLCRWYLIPTEQRESVLGTLDELQKGNK